MQSRSRSTALCKEPTRSWTLLVEWWRNASFSQREDGTEHILKAGGEELSDIEAEGSRPEVQAGRRNWGIEMVGKIKGFIDKKCMRERRASGWANDHKVVNSKA